MCVQKFLTFGGYWFHLLGYPGIRSPTVAPEPLGDSSRTAWRVFFLFRQGYFVRGCARAHPMGVAPEPSGDLSRVARRVVSVPSWVRLKDLIFSSTGHFFERVVVSRSWGTYFRANLIGACALDFGSFADPSSVGPAAVLRGPRWAKERKKKAFVACVS